MGKKSKPRQLLQGVSCSTAMQHLQLSNCWVSNCPVTPGTKQAESHCPFLRASLVARTQSLHLWPSDCSFAEDRWLGSGMAQSPASSHLLPGQQGPQRALFPFPTPISKAQLCFWAMTAGVWLLLVPAGVPGCQDGKAKNNTSERVGNKGIASQQTIGILSQHEPQTHFSSHRPVSPDKLCTTGTADNTPTRGCLYRITFQD